MLEYTFLTDTKVGNVENMVNAAAGEGWEFDSLMVGRGTSYIAIMKREKKRGRKAKPEPVTAPETVAEPEQESAE